MNLGNAQIVQSLRLTRLRKELETKNKMLEGLAARNAQLETMLAKAKKEFVQGTIYANKRIKAKVAENEQFKLKMEKQKDKKRFGSEIEDVKDKNEFLKVKLESLKTLEVSIESTSRSSYPIKKE